jgi:hypothetical protein
VWEGVVAGINNQAHATKGVGFFLRDFFNAEIAEHAEAFPPNWLNRSLASGPTERTACHRSSALSTIQPWPAVS